MLWGLKKLRERAGRTLRRGPEWWCGLALAATSDADLLRQAHTVVRRRCAYTGGRRCFIHRPNCCRGRALIRIRICKTRWFAGFSARVPELKSIRAMQLESTDPPVPAWPHALGPARKHLAISWPRLGLSVAGAHGLCRLRMMSATDPLFGMMAARPNFI